MLVTLLPPAVLPVVSENEQSELALSVFSERKAGYRDLSKLTESGIAEQRAPTALWAF